MVVPRITGLSDREAFSAALINAMRKYRRRHKRYPTQVDLIDAGYRSIVLAASRHHHGMREEFRRAGRPPQKLRSRPPTGLAIWSTFALTARPVWRMWLATYGCLPTRRGLWAKGFGRIIYAVEQHHHGLRRVHRKLGFSLTQMSSRGRPSMTIWNVPRWLDALRQHFPEELAWGIAPTWEAAKAINGGFIRSVKQYRGKWPAVVQACGLELHRPGMIARRRVEVMLWGIEQYERHHQWPSQSEGPHLDYIRRPGSAEAWAGWLADFTAHPLAMKRLRDRLLSHREWARQHEPNRLLAIQRLTNQIILTADQQCQAPSLSE